MGLGLLLLLTSWLYQRMRGLLPAPEGSPEGQAGAAGPVAAAQRWVHTTSHVPKPPRVARTRPARRGRACRRPPLASVRPCRRAGCKAVSPLPFRSARLPLPQHTARGGSRNRSPIPGTELTNVVVFLQDAPQPQSLPATRARIVQQNETFVPRVVAITRGSTVDFPNADPFFHDVFSLSRSGDLRPRVLSARTDQVAAVPQGRPDQGLLPHSLAHDGQHHGVRPSVLHHSAGRRHLRD